MEVFGNRREVYLKVSTPILYLVGGPLIYDLEHYCILIYHFVYLFVTRVELSSVFTPLLEFMPNPQKEHLDVALCVFRYLKYYPEKDILFYVDCDLQLFVWWILIGPVLY